MRHALDRPIWSALETAQAAFAIGDETARRFVSSVSPFAASIDDAPESLVSLARLAEGGGAMVFLQADPVRLPHGLVPKMTAEAVQMICRLATAAPDDPRVERLAAADIGDMLELARLTNPGPITARALELGGFWGIRHEGRLVAMAGERLRQPGHVELSGVCVHPQARGRGLARLLSLYVASQIRLQGAVPYLHAYATNLAAIRLYETIGFEVRSTMYVAMVEPPA